MLEVSLLPFPLSSPKSFKPLACMRYELDRSTSETVLFKNQERLMNISVSELQKLKNLQKPCLGDTDTQEVPVHEVYWEQL